MDLLSPNSDDEWKLLLALIAVVGGLVGSFVGFLSNQMTTSRQIARQERDKRRDAYSGFLGAVAELKDAHRSYVQLMQRAVLFRDQVETDWAKPLAADIRAGKDVVAEADEVRRLINEKFVQFGVLVEDLTLYAPGSVRLAAARVARGAGYLIAAHPLGNADRLRPSLKDAEGELSVALKDFMLLARADTRSAGSAPLWKAWPPIRRRWNSTDSSRGPRLTAAVAAEMLAELGEWPDGRPDSTKVDESGPPE
jgi:hypothetical protein